MRLMASFFLVFTIFAWSELAGAETFSATDCAVQLATRLGAKGATTLVLSPDGRLDTWADGFRVEDGARVASPFIQSSQLPLSRLNAITGLAAEILPDGSQTILGVTESNGALSLISPLGNPYPFLSPELGHVTALAFHSSSDRNTTTLWVGAGQRLYRLTMRWREIEENSELQKRLLKGLVKVTTIKATLPGERDRIQYEVPSLSAFDFSGGASYLLGSMSPGKALEITDFEKVLTFKDETRMRQIDHISPLDESHAVVASKWGQTLLIDTSKKETLLTLNFHGMVIVNSLSAHRIGKETEVWATTSTGQLYRWQSKSGLNVFREVPFGGGTLVTAKKVATAAFPAPRGYAPGRNGEEGFLSQVHLEGSQVLIERVIVLGSDDNLYGFAEPISGIVQPGGAREWLKVERPK